MQHLWERLVAISKRWAGSPKALANGRRYSESRIELENHLLGVEMRVDLLRKDTTSTAACWSWSL